MLDPRRLAVLREFAAQGTIARAAQALSFTSSAVSQQLAQLQREAGVELFRKVGRRLELTDAGRTLVARADELLGRVEEIGAELAAQAGEAAVALASLHETVWVAARADTAFGDMFVRLCRSVGGFEPEIRHRVSEMQMLLDLVASGRVAAVVPALGRPEREPRVAVHRMAEGRFTRALYVSTRASDRRRPSTAAVVDAVRREATRALTRSTP